MLNSAVKSLRNFDYTLAFYNPFENIPDEDTEMEDITELQIDQEEGTEDTEVAVD